MRDLIRWSAVALVLLPASVGAAELPRYYFTAGIGATRWDASIATECVGNDDGMTPGLPFGVYACTERFGDDDSFAVRLGGGRRVNDWLAVEVAYAHFGNVVVDRRTGNSARLPGGGFGMPIHIGVEGKYRLEGVDASAVLSWPIHRSLVVTGRLGALAYRQTYAEKGSGTHGATWHWKNSDYGVAPLFGVGLRYLPDRRLALGAEWIRAHRAGKAYGGWRDASGVDEFDVDAVLISISLSIP